MCLCCVEPNDNPDSDGQFVLSVVRAVRKIAVRRCTNTNQSRTHFLQQQYLSDTSHQSVVNLLWTEQCQVHISSLITSIHIKIPGEHVPVDEIYQVNSVGSLSFFFFFKDAVLDSI